MIFARIFAIPLDHYPNAIICTYEKEFIDTAYRLARRNRDKRNYENDIYRFRFIISRENIIDSNKRTLQLEIGMTLVSGLIIHRR